MWSFGIASADLRSKCAGGRLGVLAGRDFRRFYAGYSASLLGTAMSSVAIAFAVLGSGGTPTALGIVLAANIAPMVAFLLGGGALADRLGRRPVMLAADLARCAAQGALAAALFLGHPGLWLFVAAALAVGSGEAFFSPALSGLPVQLAPPGRLGDANALLALVRPAAQVAGPAGAGILIAVTSPAVVVGLDAASYAASAVALAGLRFPAGARPRSPSLARELAEGWAQFTAHPWLWLETVQFALFNLLTWGPYLVLGPVLARAYLGGAGAWGAIAACYGGGAILGGLLALGRRPRRPLLVSQLATLGFSLPPLALALHLPVAAVAGGALLAGLGSAFGGAIEATVTQQRVPADALSRVGAFNMVGAFAFGPLAFAAAGPVAALVGARAVLGFGAGWAALGPLAVLAVPSVRRVTWLYPVERDPALRESAGGLSGCPYGFAREWAGQWRSWYRVPREARSRLIHAVGETMRNISARLKRRAIKGAALAGAISLSALAGVGLAGSPAHATALKADGCALAVSIAHPHAAQTETLTVKTSVASTHVVVRIHYKTVSHTWNFTTPHDRESVYRFGVGRPTKGYRVTLAGSVTAAPKGYRDGATCSTGFTPN